MIHLDNDTLALEYADQLSREELEELYALKACRVNPDIVTNVMVFEKLCLALSGSIPEMEAVEEIDFDEAVVAVKKLLNHKVIQDVNDLGEQVCKYITILAVKDGWVLVPPFLDAIQARLNFVLPDQAHEMFEGVSWESLTQKTPSEEESVLDLAAAKTQALVHLLSLIEEEGVKNV